MIQRDQKLFLGKDDVTDQCFAGSLPLPRRLRKVNLGYLQVGKKNLALLRVHLCFRFQINRAEQGIGIACEPYLDRATRTQHGIRLPFIDLRLVKGNPVIAILEGLGPSQDRGWRLICGRTLSSEGAVAYQWQDKKQGEKGTNRRANKSYPVTMGFPFINNHTMI